MTKTRMAQVAALVAASALVLAVFLFLVLRDDGEPARELTAESLVATELASGPPHATPPTMEQETKPLPIRVYIAGAVREPEVYTLEQDSRLVDGVRAAGGATEAADLEAVNLAVRMQDEGYYFIPEKPTPTEAGAPTPLDSPSSAPTAAANPLTGQMPGSQAPDSPASAGDELVDLNTADQQQLESLPGIGPARAAAIIAHREQQGIFLAIEEITSVSGIGQGIFDNLQHLVTVGESP